MTLLIRPLGFAITVATLFACRPESKASQGNTTNGDVIVPIEKASGSFSGDSNSRTTPTPQPSPAPTDPTPTDPLTKLRDQYNSSVKAIIDEQCQVCHGRRRSLNFSDFDKVKADAGMMADAVSSGNMPPNASRLPANNKATLVQFLKELSALP